MALMAGMLHEEIGVQWPKRINMSRDDGAFFPGFLKQIGPGASAPVSLAHLRVPSTEIPCASSTTADQTSFQGASCSRLTFGTRCRTPEQLEQRWPRALSLDSAVGLLAGWFICPAEWCLCPALLLPSVTSKYPGFVSAVLGGDVQVRWRVIFGRELMVGSPGARSSRKPHCVLTLNGRFGRSALEQKTGTREEQTLAASEGRRFPFG